MSKFLNSRKLVRAIVVRSFCPLLCRNLARATVEWNSSGVFVCCLLEQLSSEARVKFLSSAHSSDRQAKIKQSFSLRLQTSWRLHKEIRLHITHQYQKPKNLTMSSWITRVPPHSLEPIVDMVKHSYSTNYYNNDMVPWFYEAKCILAHY